MLWPEFRRFGTGWGPWNDMRQLQREMDRLFSGTSVPYAQDFPAFNLWVNEEKAIVTAEVPGIDTKTTGDHRERGRPHDQRRSYA